MVAGSREEEETPDLHKAALENKYLSLKYLFGAAWMYQWS